MNAASSCQRNNVTENRYSISSSQANNVTACNSNGGQGHEVNTDTTVDNGMRSNGSDTSDHTEAKLFFERQQSSKSDNHSEANNLLAKLSDPV